MFTIISLYEPLLIKQSKFSDRGKQKKEDREGNDTSHMPP